MRSGSAVLVLFLLLAAPAFSGLITFNEVGLTAGFGPDPTFPGSPKGSIVTSQFGPAVTFSTAPSSTVAYVSSFTQVPSGPSASGNFLVVNSVPFSTPPAGTLTITFNGWVLASSLSVYLKDSEWATASTSVDLKNSGGSILQSWTLGQLEETHLFTGSGQVHSMVFTDIGSDGFALDTLSYGTITSDQVVPEPATMGLLGAGLVAIGLLRRRRRAG